MPQLIRRGRAREVLRVSREVFAALVAEGKLSPVKTHAQGRAFFVSAEVLALVERLKAERESGQVRK